MQAFWNILCWRISFVHLIAVWLFGSNWGGMKTSRLKTSNPGMRLLRLLLNDDILLLYDEYEQTISVGFN